MIVRSGDLLHSATGDRAVRRFVGDGWIVGGALELIVLLDEQPVVLAFLAEAVALHADERPVAVQLLPVEDEFELPLAQAFVDIGHRLPGSLIPHHHGAAAVLAFGDGSLEAAVFDGVVFDLNGEALVGDDVAGAFRDSPTLENAAPAEAKVVVEAGGGVLLDYEGKACARFRFGFRAGGTTGLGGHGEVAHGAIAGQLLIDEVRGGLSR